MNVPRNVQSADTRQLRMAYARGAKRNAPAAELSAIKVAYEAAYLTDVLNMRFEDYTPAQVREILDTVIANVGDTNVA